MTQATINGNTYSDDGTAAKDMLSGGHRQWFLPMVGDVVTVAGVVAGQAAQTAIDAVNAANGAAATKGTSTTSLAVSAGSKSITTQAGKQFTVGNYVTISSTSSPATMMHGIVTSYSGTALVVNVAISAGSGTYTDWTISLSGPQGATGASGDGSISYLAKTSAYTITAADKAKLIDCTSGTFSLAFQAAATLGATWATWIKNSGTGAITLDPSGGETINGSATYTLYAGHTVLLQCDGSVLRVISDTGPKQVRLPIFSAAAASKTPASSMESVDLPAYSTFLTTRTDNVAYGSGIFIASSNTAQGNISSSVDGETWTLRAMPSSGLWSVSPKPSGGFLAVSGGTTAAATSANGTSWQSSTALPGNSYTDITPPVFNGSIGLVRGTAANTCYLTSDGGATWSAQTLPADLRYFCSIGGLFWGQSGSGNQAYTSPTGLTGSWTLRTLPITPSLFICGLKLNGNITLHTGDVATQSYETSDGVTWNGNGVLSPIASSNGIEINGVPLYSYVTTLPWAKTIHNGVSATRTQSSMIYNNFAHQAATNGSASCYPAGARGVATVNGTTSAPTAIFEG